MLQTGFVRENKEIVIEGLKKRGFKDLFLVEEVIGLDGERRNLQQQLDNQLALINTVSKEIGLLFNQGKMDEGSAKREEVAGLKSKTKELEAELKKSAEDLKRKLTLLPNIPNETVPAGYKEEDNELVKEGGHRPTLPDGALPHWDLGAKFDILDFELGNKITGSGFPVFKGKGARLQRALVSYFIDKAVNAGYSEIIPPLLINADSAFGTGQLPDKEGQMYEMKEDPFFLIPTAEVPLTNMYRDEILKPEDLPVKLVGFTPCFRREAGSYGKDVRGLNRVHQFDKVEIVQIVRPEQSYLALEEMVTYVEGLIIELGLPYRIVKLCGGDLGFTSALTYDFEVFSAAQEKWLEVSSVSNFESFQTNRMMIRYKDGQNKTRLAHTLNGSALAFPRIIAALLENNQVDDGIMLPTAITKYLGFDKID